MLKKFTRIFRETNESSVTDGASHLGPYVTLKHLNGLRHTAKTLLLPKARKVARPQSGTHRSRFRGRGMEFSEVRLYQPGDDVRNIDWRVTARRQDPHTKLFNEERERPVFIVCDQSISQFFGSQCTFKSVRAAEAMALLSWTAIEHSDRVGGLVFSDSGHQEIKPARSRKTIMQMLNHAVEYNNALKIGLPTSNVNFSLNDALTETMRLAKPGTLVPVISDFHDLNDETIKQLTLLGKHCELLLIRTADPLESELPPPGMYAVSDGDDSLVIDSNNRKNRQEYAEWAASQREKLEELSIRLRSIFIELSTNDDPSVRLRNALISLGS